MKHLLVLFILVKVLIPLHEVTYSGVLRWRITDSSNGQQIELTLADRRTIFVPTAFTVIETKEEK